jgi:hypothetical protein
MAQYQACNDMLWQGNNSALVFSFLLSVSVISSSRVLVLPNLVEFYYTRNRRGIITKQGWPKCRMLVRNHLHVASAPV